MVLLELFAYLTETLLYRLNRVPEKAFIEFLRLLGVRLQPPAPPRCGCASPRAGRQSGVEIPRGTRVTAVAGRGRRRARRLRHRRRPCAARGGDGGDGAGAARRAGGRRARRGGRRDCPGQTVSARRPPVIAATGDGLDLVVGVEARPEELEARGRRASRGQDLPRLAGGGQLQRRRPRGPGLRRRPPRRDDQLRPGAAQPGPGRGAVDEPTPLAAVPPAGREIRLWYRRGGGPTGTSPPGR